ncbi:hypothetical protein ABPG75_001230 [Micractinium tetrahymenae]
MADPVEEEPAEPSTFFEWLTKRRKGHKHGLVTREEAAVLKAALQADAQSTDGSGSAGGSSTSAVSSSTGSALPEGVTPAVLAEARQDYALVHGHLCKRVRVNKVERLCPLVCMEDVPATVQSWHESLHHIKSEKLHGYIFTQAKTVVGETPDGNALTLYGLAGISRPAT